jgi:Mrp family chromosome partitioning ATPase
VPDVPNLQVLTSGPTSPEVAEALATEAAKARLTSLSSDGVIVLFDGPPLLRVADSIVVSGMADEVLLVARARRTTQTDLARSVEMLEHVDAPLIGSVLNAASRREARAFRYGEGPFGGLRVLPFRRQRKPTTNGDSHARPEGVEAATGPGSAF